MKSPRREFLAAVAVSTVACGGHPSRWRFLTQPEADTLAAVCAHIIPADRDPGAVEAGVVVFIDRQLAGFYKSHQKTYREGLAGLDASFVTLSPERQLAALKSLEKNHSPFFDLVLTHTMQGFYGSPRHGGNRDAVSWKMLGLPYPPVRGARMKTAVVVGAGAGGGVVAKELATNGFHVILLERGKWNTAYDCRKDDLRNQRTSLLGNAFGPEEALNPRVTVDDHGGERIVTPSQGGYQNNAACVGGGTLSYGAMAWRYMEKDFRMRSTYGTPAGSTLDDWPISYDDLEPYYQKAEWEIGVSGDVSNNIFGGPRRKPLPMPPLAPTREHFILKPAAQRLGLHPFSIPMLRNSVPYNGRGACMRCRWCVGFACEVDAKCGTQNTVIPMALASGNCELTTGAIVRRITTDDRGRATGVEYLDEGRTLRTLSAELVVVSGSAIESARLLLNSTSKLYPGGIGNRYDWVGRNLQGHSYAGAVGLFAEPTYDDLGPGASIAISDFNHGNPGLTGGAVLCNEFIRLPIQFIGTQPQGIPRWGQGHKDYMRDFYRRHIMIQGPTQEMPMFESRVQVDPTVRDYWGIPVARLSGSKHPHTLEVARFMAGKAEVWLKEAGAFRTWKKIPGNGLSGGQHQAGTCRMGNDPKTSVVDRECRVHEVDNVYVIDGSVHVNNGGFNPVLTIMANAYRASELLVKRWRGGA